MSLAIKVEVMAAVFRATGEDALLGVGLLDLTVKTSFDSGMGSLILTGVFAAAPVGAEQNEVEETPDPGPALTAALFIGDGESPGL
jgi:hypothetical protein